MQLKSYTAGHHTAFRLPGHAITPSSRPSPSGHYFPMIGLILVRDQYPLLPL